MNLVKKFDVDHIIVENGSFSIEKRQDNVIQEVAVALVYNGISHTVMMCTPDELDDFALGFSLAEQILQDKSDLFGLDVVETCHGIEVQMEISSRQFMALKAKRRAMAGRTGCGICGVEQLEQVQQFCKKSTVLSPLQPVDFRIFNRCLAKLEQAQTLAHQTGASHAAAFFSPKGELLAIREDVGRHVALDKLLGWHAKANRPEGFVFVTSRASFEMVQKCLACGIPMLCAISATTQMAVEIARENDFTLLAFTRKNRATIYSGEHRVRSLSVDLSAGMSDF